MRADMLRSLRVHSSLLRHLVVGAANVSFVVGMGSMLIGCDDENDPKTWVKRLDEPAKRAGAIKRLTQFFEDGMVKANNKVDDPAMKALLDTIVEPMSKAYVTGDLDEKTRKDLLKALATTRDPRASGAIKKAMKDFADGKGTADEMLQAVGYVKVVKPADCGAELLAGFLKVNPSKKELGPPYQVTQDAMLAVKDPAWKGALIDLLNKPIDAKAPVEDLRNEVYHQVVAAMVLGELGAQEAAKPLFKVALSPTKKDIAATCIASLMKLGKPTVLMLLDVLSGKDTELVEFAKKQNPQSPGAYVQTAVAVLGPLGRAEAVGPVLAALNSATDDTTKASIAMTLTLLPASADSQKAVMTVFERVGNTATLPNGSPARMSLAQAIADWMDPSVVPWLLKQVDVVGKGPKDQKEDIDVVQSGLMASAMKLMKKEQADEVKKVVDKEGNDLDKQTFKLANDLLAACGDKVGCYLEKVDAEASQAKNGQFAGIKAAYMLGALGNESVKAELLKRLPKVKSAEIRFDALKVLDKLSPNGDAKIADELQKIMDDDVKRGDQSAIAANAPMRQYIPRLRAKAQ